MVGLASLVLFGPAPRSVDVYRDLQARLARYASVRFTVSPTGGNAWDHEEGVGYLRPGKGFSEGPNFGFATNGRTTWGIRLLSPVRPARREDLARYLSFPGFETFFNPAAPVSGDAPPRPFERRGHRFLALRLTLDGRPGTLELDRASRLPYGWRGPGLGDPATSEPLSIYRAIELGAPIPPDRLRPPGPGSGTGSVPGNRTGRGRTGPGAGEPSASSLEPPGSLPAARWTLQTSFERKKRKYSHKPNVRAIAFSNLTSILLTRMSTIDLNTVFDMGGLVFDAYAWKDPYQAPADYDLLATLWGNDLNVVVGALAATPTVVRYGFVLRSTLDPSAYVVAIRGTQTDYEWLQDFLSVLFMEPCPFQPNGPGDFGNVSQGFDDIYTSLTVGLPGEDGPGTTRVVDYLASLELGADTSLTVAGHSLGSPLAALLALNYTVAASGGPVPSLITFACPNIGDEPFVEALTGAIANIATVVNTSDLVPYLPPVDLPVLSDDGIDFYSSLPPTTSLASNAGVCQTLACNHSLATYLYLLGELIGQSYPLDSGCAAPCGDARTLRAASRADSLPR